MYILSYKICIYVCNNIYHSSKTATRERSQVNMTDAGNATKPWNGCTLKLEYIIGFIVLPHLLLYWTSTSEQTNSLYSRVLTNQIIISFYLLEGVKGNEIFLPPSSPQQSKNGKRRCCRGACGGSGEWWL